MHSGHGVALDAGFLTDIRIEGFGWRCGVRKDKRCGGEPAALEIMWIICYFNFLRGCRRRL